MPLLFSYGTLQQERVQIETFDRALRGNADSLPGFEHELVPISDPQIVKELGMTHYDNARYTGNSDDHLRGMVFMLTDAEFVAADIYEQRAAYRRIEVSLSSGTRCWVYVEARTAPENGTIKGDAS